MYLKDAMGKIARKPRQVLNTAGGWAYPVDNWVRLDRFLVLGSEGGSYYATERRLTLENASAVQLCIAEDGVRVVSRAVEISEAGRAPKNDPAIFVLAMCAGQGDAATRACALAALPRVCRTGTHLFHFAEFVESFRGWGRGLRDAIGKWYRGQSVADLAYQAIKYQQRDGWGHRDLLRLAHVKPVDETMEALFRWIVKGEVPPESAPAEALGRVWAMDRAKSIDDEADALRLIADYELPREALPTEWLIRPAVWEALLQRMPYTAMLRNLATMTRVGLLTEGSEVALLVAERLVDAERLRKARVHPIAVLAALRTYASGQGARGKGKWSPVAHVVDALDAAFYAAFGNVVPTGKRWMLSLDVSGSMACGEVAGVPGLTPRAASAAMALVTAAVEPCHEFISFQDRIVPLNIGPQVHLDALMKATTGLPFGRTDCAQPMLWALAKERPVDVFVVLTDSETWCGSVSPVDALRNYRETTGIAARLIIVGMVSNGFSIADPEDGGMLDVVGFDTATPQLMADFAV